MKDVESIEVNSRNPSFRVRLEFEEILREFRDTQRLMSDYEAVR